DRNRSHWSTSKTPSYTKSVSWQHHLPGEPGFAADDSVGVLEYVNDEGVTVREEMKPEMGDYGRVYDALYQTITNGAPNYVKESEVLTNLEILERGFEQASPSAVTLAR
ncbi:Gfo/Idh/MocA family oxidoreductase, partial [Escherichia coli]|nr:Gfo/Idh/MocA family oxidoreductase [Escherichia coli]